MTDVYLRDKVFLIKIPVFSIIFCSYFCPKQLHPKARSPSTFLPQKILTQNKFESWSGNDDSPSCLLQKKRTQQPRAGSKSCTVFMPLSKTTLTDSASVTSAYDKNINTHRHRRHINLPGRHNKPVLFTPPPPPPPSPSPPPSTHFQPQWHFSVWMMKETGVGVSH